MRYNDAVKELQFQRSKKFILTGEELYLKEQFERIVLGLNNGASVSYFYPGDEKEAKSALYSAGLFDDTIIVLKYIDQMKHEGLAELIKNFDCLLLITTSDQANFKSSFITSIISHCTNVQCSKMSEYGADYPTWVITKAKESGYLFVGGSEDAFFHKVGPDLIALSNELEKLFIYKKQTKTIHPEDINKVVLSSSVTSTYEILDNVLRKDTNKSIISLEKYFQVNDECTPLVRFLGMSFEKLLRIVLLNEQGVSSDGMADILSLPPFIMRTKYLPRAKSLGRERICSWLDSLCKLEVALRMSADKEKELFYNFIIALTK